MVIEGQERLTVRKWSEHIRRLVRSFSSFEYKAKVQCIVCSRTASRCGPRASRLARLRVHAHATASYLTKGTFVSMPTLMLALTLNELN